MAGRTRWARWSLAPDGRPRPNAPFARGPLAARVLGRVIDGSAAVGSRLPVRVVRALALIGGHLEWALRPGKRRTLATNLAHAVGAPPASRRVRSLVRHEIVNEARRSADLLWAIGKPDELLRTIVVDGAEHARDAAALGKGLILGGIHVGGWEVAAAVPAAVVPVPTSVIVADNWLAWAIQHVRSEVGLRILYRSAPAIGAARVLGRGEALLVLGDDAWGPSPRRARVRFCDGAADLPLGIATLARLTGAPILPFSVLPLAPRRWHVTIEPPVAAPERRGGEAAEAAVLQELADRWTALIRANPEHWAASFRIAWAQA